MADEIDLSSNPFVPPASGRCAINELPSELLIHIFTLGWTPERDQEPQDEPDFDDVDSDGGTCSSVSSDESESVLQRKEDEHKQRHLPFNVLVSHICARWRDVAVGNPLLWSHVRFDGPPPYDRAVTYLERAKSAPLAITVDRTDDSDIETVDSEAGIYRPRDSDPDLSIIAGIMDLIVPYVQQWQALQIMVSFYPHMHRALEALGAAGPAPLLEVLQLYHYEDTDEHVRFKHPELREQPFRLFQGAAPRLTQVALWGVHLPWDKDGCPFLSGLTDLELAYHARDVRPSFYDFARILRASPGLRTLTLCLSCPADTPADWPASGLPAAPPAAEDAYDSAAAAPLVLPRLTDLVLAYLEPAYLLALLPRLALPALASLALDLEQDDYSALLAYLASPRSLPLPQPSLSLSSSSSSSPSALRGPGVAGAPGTRSLLAGLTSLKVASLPASEHVVRDAYRQLGALAALNLNADYLDSWWVDLLFPPSTDPARPSGFPVPAFRPRPRSKSRAGDGAVDGDGDGNGNGGEGAAGGELLLPRLETLTTTGVDGQRMRELVEARAARGRPLRAVLMNHEDDVTANDEAWLRKHVDRFEFFEGSDDEDLSDDEDDVFGEVLSDDGDNEWEDEDEDEDEDDDDDDEDGSDEDEEDFEDDDFDEFLVHVPF
ncbi:hypothetical protein C8Q79DRAFT_1109896 [Trametes meyenii]|nr:hypothetical protein C8Q79DRAFT_1109896 [Trametes meyenii]